MMFRSDVMNIANEIHDQWAELDFTDNRKKEMPDELKRKISLLMGTLVENFAPANSVATDELRAMFKKGGLASVDWEKCDDQTFALFVLKHLCHSVVITSRDKLIAESWEKFSETFGNLVSDATRTPQESAAYHQRIANLKEWREDGYK